MLIKYNILSKMRSLSNLKIYIQSNPQQELAAKVSSYSFIKYGFKNVEILKLHEINSLKDKFCRSFFDIIGFFTGHLISKSLSLYLIPTSYFFSLYFQIFLSY